MISRKTTRWIATAVLGLAGGATLAQPLPEDRAPDAQAAPAGEPRQTFSQQELDQMLAPIALYPDPLLSQVLMASTYPVEVVQADRWVKANPNLSGDALADELERQPWDPSVKSLVNSPPVLAMMSDKLDWTSRLGDAFIGQEDLVMDTVQKLRIKADAAGTLKTTPQQRVVVENDAPTRVIVIEPADPEVIYVPVYDPGVVYGRWWYPDYPPYYYCPRPYPIYTTGIWFGLSFHCGPPWGYAWGRSDWRRHRFEVDVNRHLALNRSIDRARYQSQIERRDERYHVDKNVWVHDPHHRRGVWYRDAASAQRFGVVSQDQAKNQREIYRGRTNAFDSHATSVNPPNTVDHSGKIDRSGRNDRPSIQGKDAPAPRVDRPAGPVAREVPKGRDASPTNDAPAVRRIMPPAQDAPVPRRDSSSAKDTPAPQNRPNVVRIMPSDRGEALGGVDRDAASVRSDSQRGAESRRPSIVHETPSRSFPAPRIAPPAPSSPPPQPSRSSGEQPAGPRANDGGRGAGGGNPRR